MLSVVVEVIVPVYVQFNVFSFRSFVCLFVHVAFHLNLCFLFFSSTFFHFFHFHQSVKAFTCAQKLLCLYFSLNQTKNENHTLITRNIQSKSFMIITIIIVVITIVYLYMYFSGNSFLLYHPLLLHLVLVLIFGSKLQTAETKEKFNGWILDIGWLVC